MSGKVARNLCDQGQCKIAIGPQGTHNCRFGMIGVRPASESAIEEPINRSFI
jgi:hypothetical protein